MAEPKAEDSCAYPGRGLENFTMKHLEFHHFYGKEISISSYIMYLMKKYEKPYSILVGSFTTPLKNDGVKVSWDDEIPNGKIDPYIHVPVTTNQ